MFPDIQVFKPGPIKWCRHCSRYHRVRAACGFEEVRVRAGSGRMVMRLRLPRPKQKKTRARKT